MTDGTALQVLGRAGYLAGLDALVAVYGLAMRPPPLQLPGRRSIRARHAGTPAFRAVTVTAAVPGAGDGGPRVSGGDYAAGGGGGADGGGGPDGPVIAFAYGFRGAAGQWWHDVVRAGITAAAGERTAAAWLADCFEIAEVHVQPEFQGQGIGRSMLLSLTAGSPHRTAVLSTLDAESPARRLYAAMGFKDLLRSFSFPGNGPLYAVMGAALPLRYKEPDVPRPSR